mmetsp:Transcript_29192/g.38387  ORF Transcript_29192/g.38387 Transcript_29192/m.38387 type:complete len:584 (+) Transcript_29192:508-2259(+)
MPEFIERLNVKKRLRPTDYTPLKKIISTVFIDYTLMKHSRTLEKQRALLRASNFKQPPDWYPYARLMRRNIIFHGGPTNSGKTYQALQRLRDARPEFGGGLYCGPLRLLAMEVYNELNHAGIYCSLLTGQDKRLVPFATHASCTIELCDINKTYDVVVIDEIQLLASKERGAAWTRAFLGLQAREIHVCGGLEAAELVKSLCKITKDNFKLQDYERMTPLEIQNESLQGNYSNVQPGDCVVAFSRADIYSIKHEIEATTPHRCCVVYGALPSETRSQQAKLFNDPNSEFDVLVASDAVGLGLNLNIRRMIFHTVYKWHGPAGGISQVEPTLMKQIGGRAGRRSSEYSKGKVTCLMDEDLEYLDWAMGIPLKPLTVAGLFPSMDQIEAFGENLPPTTKLTTLLEKFMELSQVDSQYFLCNNEQMKVTANYLKSIDLPVVERFKYCMAPCNVREQMQMRMLYHFAQSHSLGRPVSMNLLLPDQPPTTVREMQDLCSKHNVIDLYLWLANHFPATFLEIGLAMAQKEHVIGLIHHSLVNCKFEQENYSHRATQEMVRSQIATGGFKPTSEFAGDSPVFTRNNDSNM